MIKKSVFAEKVYELRHEHKLTQKELAEKSGLSLSSIRRIEQETRNNSKFPRSDTVEKLAQAFEVSESYLISGKEEEIDTYMYSFISELKNLSSNARKQYHDMQLSGKCIRYLKLSEDLIDKIKEAWSSNYSRQYILETIIRYASNRPQKEGKKQDL